MAVITALPQFVGAAPLVLNTGTQIYVSMPLSNVGGAAAPSVFVTGLTLGAAQRLSPLNFPMFVGDLAIGNDGAVNARFNAAGLSAGQKVLLTVRGTYGPSSSRTAFAVNRFVTVPAAAPYPVPLLSARVTAVAQPAAWNYTIFNDEPTGSSQNLAGFSLSVAAAVSVTGTPPGWSVETDNASYVYWFAADEALPFSHHVRPGSSLSGFQIQSATPRSESTAYLLTSWRLDTNEAGLVTADVVLSPGRAY